MSGEAMKKSAFYKDIRRTLKKNLSRFIAITVMAALGIGVFSGFAVGCLDAFKSADNFFDKQNTYDIKIVSTLGLTKDDISAISKMEGVSSVFGSPGMDVKVQQSRGSLLLANLSTLDTKGMNKPYVLEGKLPTKSGEIAVNSKFIEDTGLKLGDSITLTENDIDDKAAAKDTGLSSGEKENKSDLAINIEGDSSAPSLVVKDYKITSVILSPLDISNTKKGIASVSFSSSSNNYMMYVTADCIKSDIYNYIYATLDGASKLDGYSEKYKILVDNMTSKIKSTLQEKRQRSRYDEVVGTANAKIIKAEVLLRDKMAEAEQKLSDAQKKIDDGWVEVNDGLSKLKDNETKLLKGEQILSAAEKSANEKLSSSQKDIDIGWTDLKVGEEKLKSEEAAALEQFSINEHKLAESSNTLNRQEIDAVAQLTGVVSALPKDAQKIWNSENVKKAWADMLEDGSKAAPYLLAVKQGETPAQDQVNDYNAAMVRLKADTQAFATSFIIGGASLTEEQISGFSSLAVAQGTLNYSQTLLKKNSAVLAAQKAGVLTQLSNARQKIEDSKAQLTIGQKKLNDSKAEAEIQFAEKHAEINDGKQKLADAKKKLNDARVKLIDGQAELNKNKSEYNNTIADARQKLSDAKDKVSNISAAKWYIWDRSDNDSIAGLKSDISFIQEVTKAFPIIFFLVAVLISLTTMTRMVEEDRGLIGTYKSLGYSNYQISLKYILYAVLACVIGGIFGSVIGFVVLPKVIAIVTNTLYVIPKFQLSFNPYYGFGGFGLFLLGISGATAISCVEMLRQRPAELLRPKAPKAGSRILLERISFVWKKLNFLNKVTCRNLFRYKKRAIMTITGILGCTMLIVLGFGVKDSVGSLMSDQFDKITVYDAIVVTDNLNTEKVNTLANEWKASGKVEDALQLQIKTLTLRSKSDSLDITVMVIPDGADLGRYVHLYDSKTHKSMILPKSGIVVTQNAAKKLGLTSGDIVAMQNENNIEHDFTVSYVATNYAGNYVYVSESCYQEAFGDHDGTSFLLNLTNKKADQKWLDDLSDDERILKVNSSQSVKNAFSDVNNLINMVVYLLIGMSAVLALTVLFTLSNINISERERELATIKVLGFQREEVYSYVNRETFILTLLGILCGLPAGYGITYGILANVSIADIAFKVRVSVISYLIAAAITMIFAVLVNKITNKSLRKINMVEALKSVE
ncbi:efflux ABC transporter, permease protein [Clostridiales bacterium oral taxon 876 str. F0540]|nr:efflux ABC transporter, permease protein [Clostridiales bacterium oral taxon 876 str. F0540]